MTSLSLKPGWKMVKFGEVVKNANLVERDPESNNIERIVGLEHIDPENLHIRRWNSVADGTSFTRKFVPGQTLFGKRRAYQRKVAYAEFEGICSGDILTFEPKSSEVLLPELLPFICQSDAFFDHALGTSAGSLSPRTSWKALQDFEFPLPPLDAQKRIAEILWAADEDVEASKGVVESVERLTDTYHASVFNELISTSPVIAFEEVLRDKKSLTYGILKPGKPDPSGVPMIRAIDIEGNKLNVNDLLWVSNKLSDEYKRTRLEGGEVLLTVMATIGRCIVVPDECRDWNVNRAVAVIRLSKEFSPDFVFNYLTSPQIQRKFELESIGSAQKRINLGDLKKFDFPKIDITKQHLVSTRIAEIKSKLKSAQLKLDSAKELLTRLINEHARMNSWEQTNV